MPRNDNIIESILRGTSLGRTQSVGVMDVIPILGEDQDSDWSPPEFQVNTRDYGTINVRNTSRRPTIVPTSAGFVTKEYAQDHATPSARLVGPGEDRTLDRCCCIQETQGGLIRQHEMVQMVVLPAVMRSPALAKRNDREYNRLWQDIRAFNSQMGVQSRGNLVAFLDRYEKELDQFVAQFEIVPSQIGAIIAINGRVMGIEMTPNEAFWVAMWEPLVRVCYGSTAILVAQKFGATVSPVRVPLEVREKSLEGIKEALNRAQARVNERSQIMAHTVSSLALMTDVRPDDARLGAEIRTVATSNGRYAGQMVTKGERTSYLSLAPSGVM